MLKVRNDDVQSFTNYLRMPPDMFQFLLNRLKPRLQKKDIKFRRPLEPGLKLAVVLRHLQLLGSTTQYFYRHVHVHTLCSLYHDHDLLDAPSLTWPTPLTAGWTSTWCSSSHVGVSPGCITDLPFIFFITWINVFLGFFGGTKLCGAPVFIATDIDQTKTQAYRILT